MLLRLIALAGIVATGSGVVFAFLLIARDFSRAFLISCSQLVCPVFGTSRDPGLLASEIESVDMESVDSGITLFTLAMQ